MLSWRPAGVGARDQLWLSPHYTCGPGTAVRGGIPVIFPQFADRGPFPRHGIARDRAWRVCTPIAGDGAARWSAELLSDEHTRELWPYDFAATIDVCAAGSALEVVLGVRNTGVTQFEFTAALHSYLTAGPGAMIAGLGGRVAANNADAGAPIRLDDAPLDALARRDVAVVGATDPITLHTPDGHIVRIEADALPDRVVWNPGPQHGLADVPAGAADQFVCIEPAVLEPVVLMPGAAWRAQLRMAVS